MIDAAVGGYGIAYVPGDIVERQIAPGEQVQVLDDWSPFFDGYFEFTIGSLRVGRPGAKEKRSL